MSKCTVIVSRQVRVSAARRMASEFAKVLDALEQNPYQFPAELDYNLPEGAYRKALFSKWYKAIFSVAGETVYLERRIGRESVFSCQKPQSHFPRLRF